MNVQKLPQKSKEPMLYLTPAAALIAGCVILVFPRILNYVIAFYLILIGILGLLPPR